jgi:cytochrome c-type biogenesis protein
VARGRSRRPAGAGANLSVFVAFAGGVFSFLSPCVLPLFPSYLSFITGMSVDQLQTAGDAAQRRRVVLGHSLAFILGFSTVFVGMGASFSALSQLLVDYRDLIRRVGGALIIVFGLYLAGALRLAWLGRSQQVRLQSKPAGLVGSWLVGVTFAVGWTPCVGPILGSILTLAGTSETVSTGVTLLAAYSAGLAVRRSSCRRSPWACFSPPSGASAGGCLPSSGPPVCSSWWSEFSS